MLKKEVISGIKSMYEKRFTREQIEQKLNVSKSTVEYVINQYCDQVQCKYCKKMMPRTRNKYCSEECKKAQKLETNKAYHKENYKKEIRYCEICGKKFSKNGRRTYCSIECANWARRVKKGNYNKPDLFRTKQLAEDSKEAREKKMSYGEYMAQQTLQKMHEEMELRRAKLKIGSV